MSESAQKWLEWEEEWRRKHPGEEIMAIPNTTEFDIKDRMPLPEILKNVPIGDQDPFQGKPASMEVFNLSDLATHYDENGVPCGCAKLVRMDDNGAMICSDTPFEPKLWDVEPEAIVHIAGFCLTVFGRYMRQRCDWCGIILLEYDLARTMVTSDEHSTTIRVPASWTPGALVRVDGALSAEIVNPETVDGQIQLKSDSCVFDPKHQVR